MVLCHDIAHSSSRKKGAAHLPEENPTLAPLATGNVKGKFGVLRRAPHLGMRSLGIRPLPSGGSLPGGARRRTLLTFYLQLNSRLLSDGLQYSSTAEPV